MQLNIFYKSTACESKSKMTTPVKEIEITKVNFVGNGAMLLSDEGTFIVSLDKFKAIETLTPSQKEGFEIIDGENLSFLALDENL